MKAEELKALWGTLLLVALGSGFAWAGGNAGEERYGYSVFAMCVGIAFIIQWLVFFPSFFKQTERYFDLTGGLTYIILASLAFWLTEEKDARSTLLFLMVGVWAGRLGAFLFRRIHKSGKDGRFDELKKSFIRFLAAWTLQGLWITFTLAAALAAITSTAKTDLGVFAVVGTLIWLAGFSMEAVADWQKSRFTSDPNNKGKFIDEGLWSRSRHPNYFGEIVLWIGVAVIAFPVMQGWQYLCLSSPAFVALLLIKVSGIPLLEKRADEKWGGGEAYEAYKRRTPVLVPRIGN